MASRKDPNPFPIIYRGEIWMDQHGRVTVMAVVENWVMARRPGCIPFLTFSREFVKEFSLVERKKKRKKCVCDVDKIDKNKTFLIVVQAVC